MRLTCIIYILFSLEIGKLCDKQYHSMHGVLKTRYKCMFLHTVRLYIHNTAVPCITLHMFAYFPSPE